MLHAAGVTIAATGGKDRVVRLFGLAPLVPSPVQKPQIATLRVSGTASGCVWGVAARWAVCAGLRAVDMAGG